MPTPDANPKAWRCYFQGGLLALGILGVATLTTLHLPWNASRLAVSSASEISRGPVGSHRIALTFDAGGEADGLPVLLNALDAAKVRCTFFLTGKWALSHPALARDIHARGHELGNHTWDHPDLTSLDDTSVCAEILRNESLQTSLFGDNPRPLFRAPYGARDARVLRILRELGYVSIYWTYDSLDSNDPPKTVEFLFARVTDHSDQALDGAIILMHVGEPATAAAVPLILADFQHRGFKLVTVGELLSLKASHWSAPVAGIHGAGRNGPGGHWPWSWRDRMPRPVQE